MNACNDVNSYLSQRRFLIRPTGFAKAFNLIGNSATVCCGALDLFWSTASAQVSGLSGVRLLQSAPLMVIGIPSVFGLGCAACECVTRGTPFEPAFYVSSRVLVLLFPLKCIEIVLNNGILICPSKLLGIPLVVNLTDTVLAGFGLNDKLYASMLAKASNQTKSGSFNKLIMGIWGVITN